MQEPHPQRIEWLLEFLRKDIAFDGVGRVVTFTPLEMRHLCTNVEWYLLGPKAELDESDKVRLTGAPNSFERGREVLSASDLEREIWRGQVLARLQSAVLAGMKTLEAGEAWRASEVHVRGQMIDRRVGWALEHQPNGTVVRRYENAHIDAILLAAASDLVAEWWPQLRRCRSPDCGAWFLPSDKRQLYHEPVCRHRNFARMRERDYAEEHAARIERTKGRGPAKRLRKKQATKKARRKGDTK